MRLNMMWKKSQYSCRWLLVFLVAYVLLTPPAIGGGAVTGGATEWTQIANNFELLESVRTQIDTYNRITQSLNLARLNIQSLPGSFLTDSASALIQLQRAVIRDGELGRAAVYSLENYDREYPGYEYYLERSDPEQNIETYTAWDIRSRENVRSALQAVGANREQLITEGQLIRRLQRQSQNAGGQKQAMQAGNEIALAQIAQNQRLQTLLERQIELQANYQLQEQDRRESGRAAADKVSDWEPPGVGDPWYRLEPLSN